MFRLVDVDAAVANISDGDTVIVDPRVFTERMMGLADDSGDRP